MRGPCSSPELDLTYPAHIFCTLDQVEAEIIGCFDFLEKVYKPFGFEYKVGLSTRNPNKWMGDLAVWDKAEGTLKQALERLFPGKWHINEEDAAFYGPKVGHLRCAAARARC
jgi:threonyl-tRNA synthetase